MVKLLVAGRSLLYEPERLNGDLKDIVRDQEPYQNKRHSFPAVSPVSRFGIAGAEIKHRKRRQRWRLYSTGGALVRKRVECAASLNIRLAVST